MEGQENDLYRIDKVPVSLRMFSEISPVLTDDGMVFCSDRKFSVVTNVENLKGEKVYNIYFAARKDTLEWGNAKIFSRDLQSGVFDGPFCFTPDGNQIYFTRNIETGKRTRRSGGSENNYGIFIADRLGETWANTRPFEHNDPLWKTAHPFISSDGKYLFFASDMPGGSGGSDIYMCEWLNGRWSVPVNLGSEVNSRGADLYPCFSQTQELFFASDRNGGYGGLDIYSSRLSFGSWSEPLLLPEPLNSSSNDFSLVNESGSSSGFFTSDRDRSDDIYRFTSLIIRKSQCDSIIRDSFCYEFIEENAVKFDSVPYEYEWDYDDGGKALGATSEHCFAEAGTYIVKLNVIDKVTGEVQYNEVNYVLDIERTEQAFITAPETVIAGEQVIFDASLTNLPGWTIREYYWNFGDDSFTRGLKVSKVFTVPGVYSVQLIISSEPDAGGNVRETCVSKYIVVTGVE